MNMSDSVNLFEITVVILFSSLFSLGGGNGPIAVIQSQWVEVGILDPALFAWVLALSYLTPGPKAGFLSGVGYYLHGLTGALAAVVGIVIPTCIGATGVSYGLKRLRPIITRITLPAGFVISGMIAAAAWGMAAPMNVNLVEILVIIFVAVLVGKRKAQPVQVVLGAATIGLLWWLLIQTGTLLY
jgi:chromate transporter